MRRMTALLVVFSESRATETQIFEQGIEAAGLTARTKDVEKTITNEHGRGAGMQLSPRRTAWQTTVRHFDAK